MDFSLIDLIYEKLYETDHQISYKSNNDDDENDEDREMIRFIYLSMALFCQ